MAAQSGAIIFNGNNNRIVIGEGGTVQGAGLTFGHDCSFIAKGNNRLACIRYNADRAGHVIIEENTTFTWATRFILTEPGRIMIGEDCMISSETLLTVSDMHSIIDIESGRRINPAADITLAPHVWIGAGVSVMKGGMIGTGSIIGYGAVVAGRIPENCIAAGVPARPLRRGVTWRRDLI